MNETWRYILTGQAQRDIRHLDRVTRRRVFAALDRLVAQPGPGPVEDPIRGDVRRLRDAPREYRLRVSDWRVRFTVSLVIELAEPPAVGEVHVHVISVLRVLPRGRAYRD